MFKKQTSVSHSSTESEIISLDAGFRLDGVPALDLWHLIVSVLGNTTHNRIERWVPLLNKRKACSPPHTIHKRNQSQRVINNLDDVDFILSIVQSSHREALLHVFEDNEAGIKMIIKGRSPTMRRVSRTHRVALDWLLVRINLDPKIQKIHRHQKPTRRHWPREISHVMNGIIFCVCSTSAITVPQSVLKWCRKLTQKDSGEERVTAKSKPMMNLVARCSERAPAALSSIASESLGKTRHESKNLLSPQIEKYDRTERPVVNAQHTDRFIVENDNMIHYTEAESELSSESRSFLHRVYVLCGRGKNQSSKDATKDSDKHSVMWWMFVSSTLQASVIMVKNYSDNWHSIKNTEDLTMKQVFDISEKFVTEQSDEIYGTSTINWEHSSWKYFLLWLVMNKSSVSCTERSTYSQFLYCVLEWWTRTHNQIMHGKTDWRGSIVHQNTELWTELMVSQLNSSGISSQDSPHCSSATKSKNYCQDWVVTPENLLDELSSCRCSTTSHGDLKTTKKNASQNAQLVSLSMQRDLEQDNGHSSDLDQRKNGAQKVKTVHKENGTELQSKWCWHLQKANTQSSDPRVHCPRGVLKSKCGGKLWILFCADGDTIETVFRTIISVNQSQKCCEECESCPDRTGRLVVEGQSNPLFVPSVIKTNMPLTDDDPAHKEFLLQRYGERIEKLSQQDRVSKFCTDAGFLTAVEVGQYFMTKDTEEFSQFTDSGSWVHLAKRRRFIWTKRWIRGNTKTGSVLEVATCCLQSKYGVEIRIESMNKDNSHSWVRISHGLNKLVTDLSNREDDDNEQETSEMQFEDSALRLNAGDFACRSKAKAKPQRRTSASSSTNTFPIGERTWTDIEPQEYSLSDYSVSKKLINLLRHGSLPREDDGAIEFWRIKDYLQNHFLYSQH